MIRFRIPFILFIIVAGISFSNIGCGSVDHPSKEGTPNNASSHSTSGKGSGSSFQSIYGQSVVQKNLGKDSGFNEDKLPGVVLGPPKGGGKSQGSLDVLSLGYHGWIIIDFGQEIVDIDGPELFVFENPFVNKSLSGGVFSELGKVSVSLDKNIWTDFPCDPSAGEKTLCAGQEPVLSYQADKVQLSKENTGGDAFDINKIGVKKFRYVKITDVSTEEPVEPFYRKHGFDLDAVGAIVKVNQ